MTASADLMEGWKALENEAPRYTEALAYYRGTVAERFANERIRRLVAESGQAYRFRLAAIPVKVMAKRCRIATVASDLDAATDLLERIRLANQAAIYEPLIVRKMFTFGDAYALVWPVEADDSADQEDGETVDVAADDAVRDVRVEISYQSPLHCRVIYDSEDGRRARYGIRRWLERSPLGEAADIWRAEVWYADRLESWVTRVGSKGGTAEDWEPYAEDDAGERVPADDSNWPLDHDWEELPIKHARTDLPYGEPAHAAAYGPQDAITKAITTQVVVDIEAHGWPERYRLLVAQRDLESGRDPVPWEDAASAADATTGPTTSARRRGAALEHVYPDTQEVGEFSQPDPGVLIPPIEHWVRLMSVVTETPLYELDQTVQVSGVSREKADGPLKAKEREAKSYLDAFWSGVYTLACRMAGMDQPGTIAIHWAPPDVVMDTEWWSTAQLRVAAGVPARQVLLEANYLPDQVEAWLDTQGEEMALMQRIAVMERLGAAVQSLGLGIQLGVLDQATVGRLVQRIVGEVSTEGGQ